VAMTPFEAFQRIIHRVAISETERKDMEQAILETHGNEEEKGRFYTESDADKAVREDKEKFDAAVQAEVARRQQAAAAQAQQASVSAAADQAQAS
jgi:hypothetical protein